MLSRVMSVLVSGVVALPLLVGGEVASVPSAAASAFSISGSVQGFGIYLIVADGGGEDGWVCVQPACDTMGDARQPQRPLSSDRLQAASPDAPSQIYVNVSAGGVPVEGVSCTVRLDFTGHPAAAIEFPVAVATGGEAHVNRYLAASGEGRILRIPGRLTGSASIDCGLLGSAEFPFGVTLWPRPFDNLVEGVSINDGVVSTNQTHVKVFLSWQSGRTIDQVMVSNDGGFSPSRRTIFPLTANQVPWTLETAQDERLPKVVYVRLHDLWTGQWLGPFSDDVILDTVRPQVSILSVARSATSTRASQARALTPTAVRTKAVTIHLRASDNRTGVKLLHWKSSAKGSVATRRFSSRISVRVPISVTTVWVRVRDGAGNWSPWRAKRL